jgi:hypothetical protein
MKWKQALSDYARDQFGIFGSECGREWAIPHSDFFEGLTGVSGHAYHDTGLLDKLGATVVPLFEIVYRDGIAMYGKYGYDVSQAAEYVLQHISLGRPLNYHSIPSHLYWKAPATESEPLRLRPALAAVTPEGPRRFRITYHWSVAEPPAEDWRILVHFTDAAGSIRFQNDHGPVPATSRWSSGEVRQGPFTVTVPEGLNGTFDVRIGLYHPAGGPRALLAGKLDGERRCLLGKLHVGRDGITFQPETAAPVEAAGDAGLFTHAENGWAAGMHPIDRFVKNTYEILSPLDELTARMPLTEHQFLTADRKVQRTRFGEGAGAVEVVVNASASDYRHASRHGDALLPPFGFLVDSPTFVAFYARNWNGLRYEEPTFFTLRSLDGQPLARSARVRVYHGFGDTRVKVGGETHVIAREGRVDGRG